VARSKLQVQCDHWVKLKTAERRVANMYELWASKSSMWEVEVGQHEKQERKMNHFSQLFR